MCACSGEGDEFSAGEEEGDLEEGGGDEEEMVEFITNGEDSLHAPLRTRPLMKCMLME